MAIRKIQELACCAIQQANQGWKSVQILRDSEWQEWIVVPVGMDGKRIAPAQYHTNDKADAVDTAKSMIWN